MQEVVIYTTRICPYCVRAKMLLERKGVPYKDVSVENDMTLRQEIMRKSGQRTVPQIWIGATHVGGFDDLYALERAGRLDALLMSH
ncbi:MAG: glutaredoxin 3 [Hahellaceae bacterium]|nr:glutaredoxin 3 [Hahellaceae bacterium]MCP5168827.1 glutaredoxin 3 [Hahellaceae bacterium]